MDYQSLLADLRGLSVNALAMGALGAELKLRVSGVEGDPAVRAALREIAGSVDPDRLEWVAPEQLAGLIGILTYNLQEALDMLREPDRAAGWTYEDPAILQQRGRGSGTVPSVIDRLAKSRPALARILAGNGTFLDVGTGVSWLAIEAAKLWTEMRVVGLDIWEPALKLAATNIASEGLQDRITLRRQSIVELDEVAAFDLTWLPSMFLPREVCEAALERIVRASTPDGMLVFGMFAVMPGPHGRAVTDLLSIRSGGYAWRPDEAQTYLTTLGLRDVEIVEGGGGTTLLLGRRP
jgi:hypothetical protein